MRRNAAAKPAVSSAGRRRAAGVPKTIPAFPPTKLGTKVAPKVSKGANKTRKPPVKGKRY